MGYVEVSAETCRQLALLARVWHLNISGAVARLAADFTGDLIDDLTDDLAPTAVEIVEATPAHPVSAEASRPQRHDGPSQSPPAPPAEPVAVFGRFRGVRTTGVLEPATGVVTVTSGGLAGRRFASPSGAMRAVLASVDPRPSGRSNGWRFWRDTATGRLIGDLREGWGVPEGRGLR